MRGVVDASMKTASGYPATDILLKGFINQTKLFDILCRFLAFEYVIICDICNVVTTHSETFLQNILWRETKKKSECIELPSVTYGTTSAPFLATWYLNILAKTHNEKLPLASDPL